ncbi:MAG: hypothetical protein ACT4OT_09780 [Acidobacteriota bacterium]
MKRLFLLATILVLVSGFANVTAQERTISPPPVLLIVREDIKPGKMPAHNTHSEAFAQIFGRLKAPAYRIAMLPVAGSENEVLYITALQSFAEMEKMQAETDKKMSEATGANRMELDRLEREGPDLHAGMRDMMAVYRPELSYQPGVDITKMRYMAVTTVRVRPGQEEQYSEYMRTVLNTVRDKIKAELHVAAFQVIAGSPGTTFMFFRPIKSLAEYDLRIGARTREAMGDDQKKKADKMVSESVMFTETSVYAFNPRMSFVPDDFASGDPSFWRPRPRATNPRTR